LLRPCLKGCWAIVTGLIDGSMDGTIFDSKGHRIAVAVGSSIFDLNGRKLYDLKSTNVYKLSGELVGHIPLDARSSERPLDKSADKLFR
jgi:hypothetical protein